MRHLSLAAVAVAMTLSSQPSFAADAADRVARATQAAAKKHPLLAPWSGPFGGLPPLDQVQVDAFEPAITAAMALQLKEIDAIVRQREAPSFENTIARLEDAGRAYDRVMTLFGIWSSTMADPAFQAKCQPPLMGEDTQICWLARCLLMTY